MLLASTNLFLVSYHPTPVTLDHNLCVSALGLLVTLLTALAAVFGAFLRLLAGTLLLAFSSRWFHIPFFRPVSSPWFQRDQLQDVSQTLV